MAFKLLRCFSLLVMISVVTFTMVLIAPSANISNIFSDNEESSLEFQILENTTDNFDRQLKVKLDRNSYCKKLQTYYGLSDNSQVGVSRQEKIFIIVAYRDRQEHKSVFMNEMTKYLQQKNLDFRIILVEQSGKDPFNRAKLMNIGALEALKESLKLDSTLNPDHFPEDVSDLSECYNPQVCFVFHDIDMIPDNLEIPYNCTLSPILLATSVQQFNYKLPYADYFGGVTAFSLKHFLSINGYPNRYWGWGGEDDDVYERCKYRKLNPKQLDLNIGKFKSQGHQKRSPKEEFGGRFKELKKVRRQMNRDGFRQVVFQTLNSTEEVLYKHILVDLYYDKLVRKVKLSN